MNWQEFSIRPEDSLRNALNQINRLGRHLVTVTDEAGTLLGILTDGDTRRAILSGAELDSSISVWVNRTPLTASIHTSKEDLELHSRRLGLEFIPVLDENKCVVDIYFAREVLQVSQLSNPVLIMAGGEGRRLHPLTSETPKPMIEVAGQPLIEILVKKLVMSGFSNIYIAVHYLAQEIIKFLGDGEKYGARIHYLHESTPLGTAGAINLLPATALELDLLVCNSDLIADTNFREMLDSHHVSESAATVLSAESSFQIPYGVLVESDARLISIQEKPHVNFQVNGGAYIFGAGTLKKYKSRTTLQATEILEDIINEGKKVGIHKSKGYWLDVGTIETLAQARRENSRQI